MKLYDSFFLDYKIDLSNEFSFLLKKRENVLVSNPEKNFAKV